MPTYQNLGALNTTGNTITLQTNAATGALLVDNGMGGDLPSTSTPFVASGTSTLGNTNTTVTQAAAVGKQNYVTGYLVRLSGNTSSIATTSDTFVQLQNGSGTTVMTDVIGKGATGGGGVTACPGVPLFVGNTNTASLLVVTGSTLANCTTYATIWGYTV